MATEQPARLGVFAAFRDPVLACSDVKIATLNINGVNGRLSHLLAWLEKAAPDVLCLQELKTEQAKFPRSALQKAGYEAVWVGERAYNGVAILAKGTEPIVTRKELPGDRADKQARYLEAAVNGVLVACLYAPNGNPQPGPRFTYKLRWLERLEAHAAQLFAAEVPALLVGDFNVVPTDFDIYNAQGSWKKDALLAKEAREIFARVVAQGWRDALRSLHPDDPAYTFWDYKRDAWRKGAGLRIDHFLLSKPLSSRLHSAGVDLEARGLEGASDHAPVWMVLGEGKGKAKARKK